jgi:RTX calcium-binding nonapeptide repeat (4 copies)
MIRRLIVSALGGVGLLAAMASPAGAATTIGQIAPPGPDFCGGATLFVTPQVESGTPSYLVPAGRGVLTEWSARGFSGATGSLGLKVVNQTSAMHYQIAATDGPQPISADVVNHFPIRIPVSGGELLALWVPTGFQPCAYITAFNPDVTEWRSGSFSEPNVGETFVTDAMNTRERTNVEARLEPDCDKDGFGDETQDKDISACTCKGRPASIVGTDGPDKLKGTAAADVISGGGGNDNVSGLAGNDTVCGGAGKDTLNGGKGNDKLYGESGKDTLKGGPGKDKLKGGPGKDKQLQ